MQPQQPYYGPPQSSGNSLNPNDFEFIVNPNSANKRSLKLGNSMSERLVIALGGLLVIIIIFIAISKALSSGPGLATSMLTVAEAQQELLNLTSPSSTSSSATLNADNSNVAATIQAVITSNQAQLLKYLTSNGVKYNSKALKAYTNSSLSTQLTNSIANGTYDSTFASLVQSEIGNYDLYLKQAYTLDKGSKGRALLSSQYNQSQLLLKQLVNPAK